MGRIDWKERYFINTASSYINLAARLLCGLVIFRFLYSHWDGQEFGFWSFMWSMFGYAIVLDFGLGYTVERAVARQSEKNKAYLSSLIATVFWTFVGLGAMLFGLSFLFQDFIFKAIDVPPEYAAEFSRAYMYFFAGLAVLLPAGIFPPMLDGIQRVDLGNWVRASNTLVHFGFTVYAITHSWQFSNIMLLSMIGSAAPCIIGGMVAFKKISGLSLNPRLFSLKAVREQLSFSLTAYFIAFSNILLTQTDRIIIGVMLTLPQVTLYQGGYKIGEMLLMFATQVSIVVAPAAANLAEHGTPADQKELLMKSSRLTFIMVTPFFVLALFYLDPLIRLLTDLDAVPVSTFWVGVFLLVSIYLNHIFTSSTRAVFMMSGREKTMLRISVFHAGLNMALSIFLAGKFGIVGVAGATLISSVVVSGFIVLPITSRYISENIFTLAKFHFSGNLASLAVLGVMLALLHFLAPIAADSNIFDLAWRGVAVAVPAVLCSLKTIRATWT
jgi:O-antigen/teichoic acid export membrane protein